MNKIKKPNFLCVGAQKAGTTTLHDILQQHQDIYLPESKEAHFFDMEEHYKRGLNWWVENFFSKYNKEKMIGAMTPEYLYYDEVPLRIFKTLGKDLKIIMLLRNPIDRAYSHYLMSKRRGYEDYSFKEAVSLEKERITKGGFERSHFSYISRGKYYAQVKRYFELFPRENILVIKFEDDFLKNREKTVKKILHFLEVENVPLDINLKSNKATQPKFKRISKLIYGDGYVKNFLRLFIKSSKVKIAINQYIDKLNQTSKNIPKLTTEEKLFYLNNFFLDDIKRLENFLEINLKTWYTDDC